MRNRLENPDSYEPPNDVRQFCYALVSEGVMGNKLQAEKVTKVCKGKFYYYWRKYPEFRAWYHDLCLQILGTNAAIPAAALLKNCIKGDTPAIRTYYELVGKLKGPQVNVNTGDTIIQTPHAVVFSAVPRVNVEVKEKVVEQNECPS